MAQTIKLKRSASSGAVPSTSSLELGEVAINTYDGKMYIKKNDGSDSVVEVGGTATQQTAIWQPYAYTATNNQTTFTGSDDNSRTMKYIVGYLEVYVNGLLLDPSTDYTATNGVSIVLSTAASASDLVQINTFVKVVGTGDITLDTFTGNGSTAAYTLSVSPGSENNTQVYVNAVYQNKDTYTVSGTTLTFDTAPVNNAEIEVTAGSRNVSFTDVNDLTISGDLVLADTKKLKLGDSNDLEIYHDTSNSIIRDNGAGHIQILSGTVTVGNAALSKTSALFSSGGAQTLYHDNSPKFVTSSAGIGITGNIAVSGTVDGVDIATRDGILTSTTTTAGAALPKAGGAMTGAITTNSTFDGRDVATDGTKLDGIEVGADVTDTANVTSSGALMDSEVTNLAQVKAFDSSDYATAAQGTTANAALPKAGGTLTGALTTRDVTVSDGYIMVNGGTTSNTTLEAVLWARSQVGASVAQINVAGDQWQFGGGGTVDTSPTLILDYGDNSATFAGNVGMVTGHSSGKFAVMASSVHNSYDFYNNGTSYFNGTVIIDANLTLTGGGKLIAPKLSIQNQINTTSANLEINYENGDGTTTSFKDFYVRDGKNALILSIDGSSKSSTFAGTISSGAITSSASITASGNSNSFGNTTISNLSATTVTTSGSVIASGNSNSFGNTTVGTLSSGAITSTGLVLNGGRAAEGVTAAGTYAELTRASGGDLGLLFNKDTSKWLIGIDNSDGNAANLRFMYGAYNASSHPGFGSDYSGLNLTYQGRVGVGTRYPGAELEVAGTALVENAKLKAIAESNTQTAIDVFVYDTRKDSDGGAWRKRTQHTSWYSEASDTRRGTRKDFPAVAVIVAHASGVTIYDGDDPDMPMWMYIFAGYSHNFSIGFSQNGAPTAVTARDGVIYTTTNGGAQDNSVNGLFAHNFISDRMYQWNLGGGFGYYPLPIEGRDSGGSLAYHETNVRYDATKKLVSAYLNDVAVTVLPNAPIDADTGLPVPTIAVATQGGISIIKDTGTVVDITTGSGGYTHMTDVDLSSDGWVAWSHNDTRSAKAAPIPEQDKVYGFWTYADGAYNFYESHAFASNLGNVPALVSVGGGITDHIFGKVVSSSDGLTLLGLQKSEPAGVYGDADMPLSAYITSDYNTGWMMSGIKLATLSDTDTTNATSANMAGNGNFADTSVWGPANGASLSVSGNVGTITGNGSTTQAYIGQTVSGLTVGKQYMITCDAKRGTTSAQAAITVNGILSAMTTSTSFAPLHVTFTATATSQLVLCFMNGTGSQSGTALFQNFTFRLAEADRSWNGANVHGGNALQVFGTVTKTAVATGAELVSYGPFSTSNYLQQPYNADLNFGTGNFSIAVWVKPVASTAVQLILHRRKLDATGTPIEFGINSDETPYLYTGGGTTPLTGKPIPIGQWAHVVAVRKGGLYGIYVNGKLFNSNTGQNVDNIVNADAHTLIGGYITNGSRTYGWQGTMALLRVSSTAPTAEQIAKMYNDEKHLFATNAKATLYGTSNNPLAIAYDDDTELLHVGTSAGRSEFQGLNRVNNTTDAVGAAISASNGFIVEE